MSEVKIIEVAPGWHRPHDEDFALVEVEKSGAAYFSGIVAQMEEHAAIFKTNNAAPGAVSLMRTCLCLLGFWPAGEAVRDAASKLQAPPVSA